MKEAPWCGSKGWRSHRNTFFMFFLNRGRTDHHVVEDEGPLWLRNIDENDLWCAVNSNAVALITTSSFPRCWKAAKDLPISKTANAEGISNLSTIRILTSLSKVFEILIKWQLTEHLAENNLLFANQSGFRESHSTTASVVGLTDTVRANLDKKNHLNYFCLTWPRPLTALTTQYFAKNSKESTNSPPLLATLSIRTSLTESNALLSELTAPFCGDHQGCPTGICPYYYYTIVQYCQFNTLYSTVYTDSLTLHSA